MIFLICPSLKADPRYIWETLDTPHFEIHYHQGEFLLALKVARLEFQLKGDTIVVHDDVHVTITLEQAGWIAEESAEMAVGHPEAERIGRCSLRLELTWADSDSSEATNTLGIIEPALRKVLQPMWVFDAAAGAFV